VRENRIWIWWTVAGVSATLVHVVLPVGGLAAGLLYNTVGLATAAAMLVGVHVHRPVRPGMWFLFAVGLVLSTIGDGIFEFYQYVLHEEPYPSIADAFYLPSYPMFIAGLVLLLGRLRGHGLSGLLDAAVVSTGLGVAFWIFILRPIADDAAASRLESWISTTYPTVDVLMFVLLVLLLAEPGGRSASIRLLSLAVVLLLVGDTAFSVVNLYSSGFDRPIDAAFLLSYVIWGAGALHPAMAAPMTVAVPEGGRRHARFGVAGACALLAPALLFVPFVGENPSNRRAVAIGSITLLVLVIGRLARSMNQEGRQTAELERLTLADEVTGLANRRRLELALSEALAGGRPQLALVGLNGFKDLNDELGRATGDRVLAALAGRLAGVAQSALVARTGGDEFAVLLADANTDEAANLAGELLTTLTRPVSDGDRELLIGVSVGVAGGAGVDAVELYRQAEVAMHASRRSAEPVRWSAALDQGAADAARLGAELRTALDEDQFQVVYQPIVELPSGRVKAVEALVRWHHPERGLVSPAAFIPVAEQNGLIIELGAWVMRTALLRLAAWRRELGDMAPERVSVNVSPKQLSRPGYAESVAAMLTEAVLPAACLAVEVTETAVFEGGPAVTALYELQDLGVGIALDDFGTGHSSLGLLQTVPVHTLKVDKSFVDNITEAGRHAVIAEALIQISHGLGLSAVAEGVETAEQAAVLSRLGYRYLQGYHYGRPVADPDFELVRTVAAA
jgi:diguanylate cyclase (GGDEF)-like protein